MLEPFWIVWNEKTDIMNFPTKRHLTLSSAKEEAERLALANPGQSFSVMQLMGTVRIEIVKWEYPYNNEGENIKKKALDEKEVY